jgi:hypothetical protein
MDCFASLAMTVLRRGCLTIESVTMEVRERFTLRVVPALSRDPYSAPYR